MFDKLGSIGLVISGRDKARKVVREVGRLQQRLATRSKVFTQGSWTLGDLMEQASSAIKDIDDVLEIVTR